jgi:hypothetical protein
MRGKSKTAEREREREREREKERERERERERKGVRGRALQGENDIISNKTDQYRKHCVANVILISNMIKNVANDVVPTICIFFC